MRCPTRGRGVPGLTLLALIPIVTGCERLPFSTLAQPASDVARSVASLQLLTAAWAVGALVSIQALLLFALIRFRKRPGEEGVPSQTRGGPGVHVLWAILALVPLAVVATPALRTARVLAAAPVDGALEIDVTARQWWWQIEYPDTGVVTANEIRVPVDRPIEIRLRSDDVAHGIWVPRLALRRDVGPGGSDVLRFTAEETGEYPGACAELCGASHANMRLRVVVDSQADFEAWLAEQVRPAATGADDPGYAAFMDAGCAACHDVGIADFPSDRAPGPDLTHVGSRRTLAGGLLANTPENLRRWITDADAVKPGQARAAHGMPSYRHLPERQIDAIVAFLRRLQ